MRSQHDPRQSDKRGQPQPRPGPPGIPQGQEHGRGKGGGRMPRGERGVGVLHGEAREVDEERPRLRYAWPRPAQSILQDLVQDSGACHRRRAHKATGSKIRILPQPPRQDQGGDGSDVHPTIPKTGNRFPPYDQVRRGPGDERTPKMRISQGDEGQNKDSSDERQAQPPLKG